MGRHSAGTLAEGAGTTVRPIMGLLSTASISPVLREVSLVNTTAVECTYRLVNFTAGTAGTALTERRHRRNGPPALCLAFGLWTADATIGEDTGYSIVCGEGIGSGSILAFGDSGLEAELGSTSGLGLVPVGTGQICRVQFTWDE
jgi:hypothetical protein